MRTRFLLVIFAALAVGCGATAVNASDASNDAAESSADGDTSVDRPDVPPTTCLSPDIMCGTGCVDPQTDARNCGGCGVSCPTLSCVQGRCVCPSGEQYCSGACVDVSSDNRNCGGCGVACVGGAPCMGGMCGGRCPNGEFECAGIGCTNVQSNPFHCGSCNLQCASNATCMSGQCVCPSGTLPCGPTCANLQNDPNNCGACGVACSTGTVCSNSACQLSCDVPGQTNCNGACVDLQLDSNNCGACGIACPMGTVCMNGGCAAMCGAPGQTLCSARCVDTTSDPNNCGACGQTCPHTMCSAGSCTSTCAPGFADCDHNIVDGCEVDTLNDSMNCGACGVVCATGLLCASGTCTCRPSTLACNGACIDVTSDPSNCGGCGVACASSETCVGGTCVGTSCTPSGLYGPCTTAADCAGVTNAICATDGLTFTAQQDAAPGGMCSTTCTVDSDCPSGACLPPLGPSGPSLCVPTCTRSSQCRAGYACIAITLQQPTQVCLPLCDDDAQCCGAGQCNAYSGGCTTAPLPPPGDPNGAACMVDMNISGNCAGLCEPENYMNPDGSTMLTGAIGGMCLSFCTLPAAYFSATNTQFLPVNCPAGSLCSSRPDPALQPGDLGTCNAPCATDSDCRSGYACQHTGLNGSSWTNGVCAPMDCNDGTHCCPSGYHCVLGADPMRPTVGVCAAGSGTQCG